MDEARYQAAEPEMNAAALERLGRARARAWPLGLALLIHWADFALVPCGDLSAALSSCGRLLFRACFACPEWRLACVTGFLGALTTFSTFSAESVQLLQMGKYADAGLHSAAHLFGAILATILGFASYRALS